MHAGHSRNGLKRWSGVTVKQCPGLMVQRAFKRNSYSPKAELGLDKWADEPLG